MTTAMRHWFMFGLLGIGLLAGCPGNETTAMTTDAGRDAGGDAGIDEADAGRDAAAPDTGTVDAGVASDAGDAGTTMDTGTNDDAGSVTDSGADASSGDSGTQVSGDAGSDGATNTDAGPVDSGGACATDAAPREPPTDAAVRPAAGCPPVQNRGRVEVSGVLESSELNWTCQNDYVLIGTVIVHSVDPNTPQVLTIGPGTRILGQTDDTGENEGILLVTRNGRLMAQGTLEDPIVFSSSEAPGSRAPGDWGGVTLIGRASGGRAPEGFPTMSGSLVLAPYLQVGPLPAAEDGGVAQPDETHDCGTLQYVRIEFASRRLMAGSETNGLQMYACGSDTVIDYVQIHRSDDDGIEIFGGSADIRHIVITGSRDDQLDWDNGWQGRGQFIVVQQPPNVDDNNSGIEAGGGIPVSSPTVYNMTVIGNHGACIGGPGGEGLNLRDHNRSTLRNIIVSGFRDGFIDIDSAGSATNWNDGQLTVRNSLFFQGASVNAYPPAGKDAADSDLVEADELTQPSEMNSFGDPMFVAPFSMTPNWRPTNTALVTAMAAAPPDDGFFDTTAMYMGAINPDGSDDWTAGWTAYPEN